MVHYFWPNWIHLIYKFSFSDNKFYHDFIRKTKVRIGDQWNEKAYMSLWSTIFLRQHRWKRNLDKEKCNISQDTTCITNCKCIIFLFKFKQNITQDRNTNQLQEEGPTNWTLVLDVHSNVNKDHAKVYPTKLDLWLIKKKEKCWSLNVQKVSSIDVFWQSNFYRVSGPKTKTCLK
jgi:hypothetical protein